MKFVIPLFPEPFELEDTLNLQENDSRLITVELLESKLDEPLVARMIQEMHRFYVRGQEEFEKVLPQFIEFGSMTQELWDEMVAESPSRENTDDFIQHLQAPFSIDLQEDSTAYSEGTFGLSCECSWDQEHGVGAWFENWKLVNVGSAQVAYC
jgi:hypothetical protein